MSIRIPRHRVEFQLHIRGLSNKGTQVRRHTEPTSTRTCNRNKQHLLEHPQMPSGAPKVHPRQCQVFTLDQRLPPAVQSSAQDVRSFNGQLLQCLANPSPELSDRRVPLGGRHLVARFFQQAVHKAANQEGSPATH